MSTWNPVPIANLKGPAGGGAGGAGYPHHQTTPAATWTIHHNLNAHPEPVVLLDAEPTRAVYPDVEYADANTIVLIFPNPVTGWAYL